MFLAACGLVRSSPTAASLHTATQSGQADLPDSPLPPTWTPDLPASPSPVPDTPVPDASPTPGPTPSSPKYHLVAQLDYSAHQLQVQEEITYTNSSREPLPSLLLEVEPNHYPNSFALQSLQLDPGGEVKDYLLDGHELHVPLDSPLLPQQQIRLRAAYALTLQEIPPPSDTARPRPFGYTERQSNLVDWYPYIPPYREGVGWLVHPAGAFGEHTVYDEADFEVEIDLVQPGPKLVIAASAEPSARSGTKTVYRLDQARNFVWSVSPIYQVMTATVGTVTIYSYEFPWEVAGKQVLQDTQSALQLYTELFGPYPHTSLSVVEADFLDGMEYQGLYFLSRGFYNLYDGTPRGYLTAIAAHETAHQWWYGLVGSDQALEPWLDEAMCAYSERLFYERIYPESLNWWWTYRVNYFEPSGFINGSVYDYSAFRPYRDAVYLRGVQFFEALRQTIGDEAFFAFLKDYAATESGKIATREDFFAVLEKHTQVDLTSLIKIYFK